MPDRELLRRTVAEFFEVETEKVGPEFALSGPRMQGSIARYALAAAIRRRVGTPVAAVHTAATYLHLLRCRSGTKTRLPFAVSISHTPLFAAAVVARAQTAAPAPPAAPPNPAPPSGALDALQQRLTRAYQLALVSALLGLLGLVIG